MGEGGESSPDGVAGAHADPLGDGPVLLLLLAQNLLSLEGLLGRLWEEGGMDGDGRISVSFPLYVLLVEALESFAVPVYFSLADAPPLATLPAVVMRLRCMPRVTTTPCPPPAPLPASPPSVHTYARHSHGEKWNPRMKKNTRIKPSLYGIAL